MTKRRTKEPWLDQKLAELNEDDDAVRIYLLVDEPGAALVAQGKVPKYLREQAARSLRPWSKLNA